MSTRNSLLKKSLRFAFTAVFVNAVCSLYAPQVKAQSTAVTNVRFKKDKYNRIFIPVKIDRDSLSFLFGTYSKTLRVTPYFMETRSLYPSGEGLTQTDRSGRKQNRVVFYMPKIKLGDLKFRNEETIVNYAFPDSIATGSTGTLMVYQYNWKIDNDKNLVSISKTPFIPSKTYTTVRYKNDSFPAAPVDIDGFKSSFALDMGSGTNFQINANSDLGRHLIMKYDLQPVNTITTRIHSRRLVDTVYEVVVPSIRFNGMVLKNQKIIMSSASPQNVVGTGFLGKYNVILNNSKKKKIDNIFILEKRMM